MLTKIKVMGFTALSLYTLALPLITNANSLTIDNQTNYPSTAKMNGGKCSSKIPIYGITEAHSTNTIPEAIIHWACIAQKHPCVAEVYMTRDCTGSLIAIARFDVDSGIQAIDNAYIDGFNIPYPPKGPFHLEILGGPAGA